ncbi:MAG TPA: glycosyl hydrolase, partial [Niastella sp.]|nr:glycosyl hydrolase [Niastella sp.]
KKRLTNAGNPLRTMPEGVTHSANMADPEKWVDPLRGYAYDCFNPDALLKATVRNGRVELPGGASYAVLVLPQAHPMSPVTKYMMPALAKKIDELVKAGATIIVNDAPERSYSLEQGAAADKQVKAVAGSIWKKAPAGQKWKVGKGTVVQGPYKERSFESLGLKRDFAVHEGKEGKPVSEVAWTHRAGNGMDIYFISNQRNEERTVGVELRGTGRLPEIWDPVTGEHYNSGFYTFKNGVTIVSLTLPANGSFFIVLRTPTKKTAFEWDKYKRTTRDTIQNAWTVSFDSKKGGPVQPVVFDKLKDWSIDNNPAIRYYSGTAVYTTTVEVDKPANDARVWLDAGKVANIAEVYVNGQSCGVIWTAPFQVDITKALRPGKNELKIEVTNTWFNRMKGDLLLPEKERITQTNAPFWAKDKPLLPAGLSGPVTIVRQQ